MRDIAPRKIVHDAAFVLILLAIWRRYLAVGSNKVTSANGLTSQTFVDMIAACQMVILTNKLYHDYFPSFHMELSRYVHYSQWLDP